MSSIRNLFAHSWKINTTFAVKIKPTVFWLKCSILVSLLLGVIPSDSYREHTRCFPWNSAIVAATPESTFCFETPEDQVPAPSFQDILVSNCDSGTSSPRSQGHPFFCWKNQKPARDNDPVIPPDNSGDIHLHTILYYIYALEKIVI